MTDGDGTQNNNTGADNQNGQQGTQGQQQDAGGYKPPATQAELDRIISDRLNRERARFADYDVVKDKATKYDEHVAASASDLDRAKAEAREEGRSEVRRITDARLISAEARAIAAGLKFHNPADVALVDFSTVTFNDQGEPDASRIKELIEDVVRTRPHLVAGDTQSSGSGQRHDRGQGARPGERADSSVAAGRDLYASRKKPAGAST